MSGTVADAPSAENQKGIESKILEHAKSHFSLGADEATLSEVKPADLPAGVRAFYLEKKKSYGNKFYNYLVYDNKLFSSGDENDFGNFLKEADFLAKKNLNAGEFWAVFKTLRFTYPSAVLIDEEAIKNPASSLKPFVNQVAAPDLKFAGNDATFTFYIKDTNQNEYRKYTVNVPSDYQIKLDYSTLK